MCECGCTMSDDRYTFPGPGKSLYLLTLSAECKSCDAPPGVTLELIEPGNSLYDECKKGEFTNGPLVFEKWPDSLGIAIIAGLRQHEFVKRTLQHLEGIEVAHFCEKGKFDKIGAETILEEMYEDSQVKPHFPSSRKPVAGESSKSVPKVMARFEFEITRTIEFATTVTVNAKDEDDAEAKVNQKIADGLAKGIEVTYPKEWDISSDETDYQQR